MADHLDPQPAPSSGIGPEWGTSLRPRPAVYLHAARALVDALGLHPLRRAREAARHHGEPMNPTETFPHRKDTAANRYADCRCTAVAVRSVADGETWGSDCPAALREALAWQEERHGTRAEQEREDADLAAEMAAVEAMSDDEINASLDAAGVDRELAGRKCDAMVRVCVERLNLVMRLEKVEKEREAGPHIPPALLRRIEALGFTPGSGEPVGWLVAELERLKADHTALVLGVGHPMWLPSVADAVDHPDQFNATPDEVLDRVRAVVAERDELAATLANERAAMIAADAARSAGGGAS